MRGRAVPPTQGYIEYPPPGSCFAALPLVCLGFSCSNFAKKNKRLLAVYSLFHRQDFCVVSEKVGHLFTFSSPKMGVIITELLVSSWALQLIVSAEKITNARKVGAIGYHDAFPLIANNYTIIFWCCF